MNKEEKQPNVYMIPKNSFDTGYVFGGSFKTKNFIEGVVVAIPFLGIFIYGWTQLGWDVESTVAYAAIVCAGVFVAVSHGVGDDSFFEFLAHVIHFRKSRRISKYNPRIKTELEPDYLMKENGMLPKEKLKEAWENFKKKVLGGGDGPISADITADDLQIYYDDDEDFVEKPDELKTKAELKADDDFAEVCASVPKSVIIGKTCAMIPKIITGNKYGKVVENASRSTITDKLMTLANLEQVYACNYFVPTNTLGVELLSRTVTLTRSDLNSMIEMWLSEMTERYTTVSSREYVEAYIEDQEDKTLIFPIIELEELVFQKASKERYHIVCERGTQDGISRVMGKKLIDFKDMNNTPMPAHKYDDYGIRRDGINPLTHSGYWEEEQ